MNLIYICKSWILKSNLNLYVTVIALAFIITLLNMQLTRKNVSSAPTSTESVDTHIPKGFVLVPIEVENYQNLDQILGQYGIVDIYHRDIHQKNSKLLGRGLRAIRSPHNEKNLGILVPEAQGGMFFSVQGPYFVTIHNPDKLGTEIVKPVAIPKRREIVIVR